MKASWAILVVAVLVVAGGFYLAYQLNAPSERFGIYVLNNKELIISDDEIVWYNKSSH